MERRAVFPTIGNTIVWRSIYGTGSVLRIDRIRVPWFGKASYAAGDAVASAESDRHRGKPDFARFAWFSDGWIARAPTDPSIIGDARYSLSAARYEPVWGIRFHAGSQPRTEWVNRTRDRDVGELWRDFTGRGVAFRPLE